MTAVEHGICEVLRDGRAVGLGFAVDRTHVVTCAHVVNTALGRRDRVDGTRPSPDDRVGVRFPWGDWPGEHGTLIASMAGWAAAAPHVSDAGDLAVLELNTDVPPHVKALRPRRYSNDMHVQMWGPQEGRTGGGHVTGKLLGEIPGGRIQINAVHGRFRVRPGFSGGPVWDPRTGGVVGILQAFGSEDDAVDAYMLSAERVAAAWPQWLQSRRGGVRDRIPGRIAVLAALLAGLILGAVLYVANPFGVPGRSAAPPIATVCLASGVGCTQPGTYSDINAVISRVYEGFKISWLSADVQGTTSGYPLYWTAHVAFTNLTAEPIAFSCTLAQNVWMHATGGKGDDGYLRAESTSCSSDPALVSSVSPGQSYTLSATFHNVPWPGSRVAILLQDINASSPGVYPFT